MTHPQCKVGGVKLPKQSLSVNRTAWNLAKELCNRAEEFRVVVKETRLGATLIDAGINAKGGFLAGRMITEICLGGYGEAKIFCKEYDGFEFPSIFVYTDHPAVATLGSQFAGWRIKVGNYFAMASGPARALALKPRELYGKLDYRDTSDVAVLVLETTKEPPEEVIEQISKECEVPPKNLFLILVPTSTVAGSTQISGRIVETGLHKLTELGFDPKLVSHACGYAPIAPVHPKFAEAMGRTNDMIIYGGVTYYTTNFEDDEKLMKLVEETPSSASKSYGKPFFETFKEADYDFYKIDSGLFAPAVIMINNTRTGNTFKAGKIDAEVLRRSIGLRL